MIDQAELVTREPESKPQEKAEPIKTTAKRAPSSRTKKAQELEGIRDTLTGGWVLIGGGLSFALPATGAAFIYQAEDLTTNLITWAKSSPRVYRSLMAASRATGAFGFAAAMGPVLIAAGAEMGLLPKETVIALLPKEVADKLSSKESQAVAVEDALITDDMLKARRM